MNKPFYVTTPIYYPTGTPHIGSAYTTFIADTLARYHRQQGSETFFLTGTDEHGNNIAKKAEEQGISPQEYVDNYADIFQNTWKNLNISNDFFIRTTQPEHEKFAAEVIQKAYENGDIYPDSYSGWYCESCEAYYEETDLVDGKCPNHPTKSPIYTTETNYFFKWSKYQDWLLELYEQNPEFIQPTKWANWVKEFVSSGLKDIPVTRANVSWGVKVPFAPEQTIYVWYDALPNYLSIFEYPQFKSQNFGEKFWPQAVHVVGKDILKFHAILWPAMLKSAGYSLPKTILVNGFFTVNGQKIGKSNGNAVDPVELSEKYGVDAVRYALLSEFKVGNDGDFSFDRLDVKYQSDLSANWGNLHNRIIVLAEKFGVEISQSAEGKGILVGDSVVANEISKAETEYHRAFNNFEIFEAIQSVGNLASFANKYVADKRPWELETKEAAVIIADLLVIIKKIAELYVPILPETAQKALESIQNRQKIILFPKID